MKLNNVLGMKVGKVIPRYCIQPILTDNTKKLVLWVHGYTVLIVNVLIGGDFINQFARGLEVVVDLVKFLVSYEIGEVDGGWEGRCGLAYI